MNYRVHVELRKKKEGDFLIEIVRENNKTVKRENLSKIPIFIEARSPETMKEIMNLKKFAIEFYKLKNKVNESSENNLSKNMASLVEKYAISKDVFRDIRERKLMEELKDLGIESRVRSANFFYIKIDASTKLKKFLEKYFSVVDISNNKSLELTKQLFSKYPSLPCYEYFMNEKHLTFDIENFRDMENGENCIYAIGISNGNNYIVLHNLKDIGSNLNIAFHNKLYTIEVKKTKNIVKEFNEIVKSFDPYFFILQWAQYDLGLLRKFGFEVSNFKPRFRGSIREAEKGRPTKVKFPGKNIADTANISRTFFQELPNFKLETLAYYFLNEKIKKYEIEQLEEIANKAKTEKSFAKEIIKYNATDILVTEKLWELFKKPLVNISVTFKKNIEDIVLGNKFENSFEVWQMINARELFNNNARGGILKIIKKEKEQLSNKYLYDLKRELFEKLFKKEIKKGVFDCYVFFPTILARVFEDSLTNTPEGKALKKFYNASENFVERNIYAIALDLFLAYPFFKFFITRDKQTVKLKRWFEYCFYLERRNFDKIKDNFKRALNSYYDLKKYLINYGKKYIYVENNDEAKQILERLKQNGLADLIRSAKCYSIDNGKIVFYINNKIYMEGIEASKELPQRFPLVNQALMNFFKLIFERNEYEALKYLINLTRKIKSGKVNVDDLVFEKDEINKSYYEYIINTFPARIAKEFKLVEGQNYSVVLTKEGFSNNKKDISYEKSAEYFVKLIDPYARPLSKNWAKEGLEQLSLI